MDKVNKSIHFIKLLPGPDWISSRAASGPRHPCSIYYIVLCARPPYRPLMPNTVFSLLQPAIMLTPINCTQTPAPPTEESLTNPEPHSQEPTNQSEDTQETSPTTKKEEHKLEWNKQKSYKKRLSTAFYIYIYIYIYTHMQLYLFLFISQPEHQPILSCKWTILLLTSRAK